MASPGTFICAKLHANYIHDNKDKNARTHRHVAGNFNVINKDHLNVHKNIFTSIQHTLVDLNEQQRAELFLRVQGTQPTSNDDAAGRNLCPFPKHL